MANLFAMESRRILCRFILYFFLINIILSLLVAFNYRHILPNFNAITNSVFEALFIWAFLAISFIAQISILFLFGYLVVIILAMASPRFWIVFLISIFINSILVFALLADSMIFNMYHMHYAAVGWEVFKANAFSHVIPLSSSEIIWLVNAGIILLLIESMIGWQVLQHITKDYPRTWPKTILIIIAFCIISSYGLNFLVRTSSTRYNFKQTSMNYLMVKATRFIPYYDEIFHVVFPIHDKIRHVETSSGAIDFQLYEKNRPLKYPKQILQCQIPSLPLNVVMIGIDAWRFDAMTPRITPHIAQFAKQSSNFLNHWSGGNCTQAGLFSLFYGIPANYWNAFLKQQRGPVLIHQFNQANYKIAIFSSAQLNFPAFDQTIFREVKPLIIRMPGVTTIARDRAITQAFKTFLLSRNKKQPFFSFIFYDAAHNYCKETAGQHPFRPWIKTCDRFSLTIDSDPKPYLHRYQNVVYFIDHQINTILIALQKQDLLKNTIVIITADHGEEINDHRSGYWQHASAHTPLQLHIPFLIYWPNQQPNTYQYFTSHYDVVPTLMKEVLNCRNVFQDYTMGQSLFTANHRPLLISGGYADYAIIADDQITRVYQGGDYAVDDQKGQPIERYNLKIKPLQQAFNYLNEFYK